MDCVRLVHNLSLVLIRCESCVVSSVFLMVKVFLGYIMGISNFLDEYHLSYPEFFMKHWLRS